MVQGLVCNFPLIVKKGMKKVFGDGEKYKKYKENLYKIFLKKY